MENLEKRIIKIEIKLLIENYISKNGGISQEQIDEFIWDVIGEACYNTDDIYDEICDEGAFGWLVC